MPHSDATLPSSVASTAAETRIMLRSFCCFCRCSTLMFVTTKLSPQYALCRARNKGMGAIVLCRAMVCCVFLRCAC